MVIFSRAGGLLLLAFGFFHQAAAVCTRSITAKQGDTCATLAAQAGITVTQFLRSNPSVTSCSQLVAGASYCVEGTSDSAPTPSSTASAPPTSTSPSDLVVSTDGTCGQGVTCAGSRFGNCCSAHGFCGSTDDYCGDGCQPGFGSCGGGGGVTPPPVSTTVTVTVTSITAITRTSLVYQTSTITASLATATVTRTSTTTSTSIDRITTIVTRTSTTTSTSIDRITTIVTSTHVITSACPTAPTKTIIPITTTTTAQPGTPSPTLPGTPRNCKRYDMIQKDDTCRTIATRNHLSLLDFYDLNPSISCDALWEGYYVCIGR